MNPMWQFNFLTCQHNKWRLGPQENQCPKDPKPKVTRMYKRGKSLVFSSHGEKGAKASTSAKQGPPVQDKNLVEHEFELVDLEAEN